MEIKNFHSYFNSH